MTDDLTTPIAGAGDRRRPAPLVDLEPYKRNLRCVQTSPTWADLAEILFWYQRDVGELINIAETGAALRDPAPPDRPLNVDPDDHSTDRAFIERKWREGVAEAEYCASCCSLQPDPIANPYDPNSLAGTWWLRGYESMRAILRQPEDVAGARLPDGPQP